MTTTSGHPEATSTKKIPLSLNQEFVLLFDQGDDDGPFGPHYHIVEAWRVTGAGDAAALRIAVHCGRSVPVLPEAPQYREFALWQRESPDAQPAAALDYWRKPLDGALISAIPTDFARSAGIPQSSGAHRFSIPAEVVTAAARLGRSTRSTTVMVLLAAYQIVVGRKTGSDDAIVATFP